MSRWRGKPSCISNAGAHLPVTVLFWWLFLGLEPPWLESLCDKTKRLQQSTVIGKNCLELKFWGWGEEFPCPAYPCSAILTCSSQALLRCSNFQCKKSNVNKIAALYPIYTASCLVCLNLPVLHKRSSVFFNSWHEGNLTGVLPWSCTDTKPIGRGQLEKNATFEISRQFWQSKQRRKWRVPTLLVFSRE